MRPFHYSRHILLCICLSICMDYSMFIIKTTNGRFKCDQNPKCKRLNVWICQHYQPLFSYLATNLQGNLYCIFSDITFSPKLPLLRHFYTYRVFW